MECFSWDYFNEQSLTCYYWSSINWSPSPSPCNSGTSCSKLQLWYHERKTNSANRYLVCENHTTIRTVGMLIALFCGYDSTDVQFKYNCDGCVSQEPWDGVNEIKLVTMLSFLPGTICRHRTRYFVERKNHFLPIRWLWHRNGSWICSI